MKLRGSIFSLHNTITIGAFLILIIASTYRLSESPGIWFDEGMFTQTALNFEQFGIQGIQTAPGEFISAGTVTGGFPFVIPVGLSYKLFGPGVLQGRAVMVLFILGFVAAAYTLIRLLFGAPQAGWSVLLLSSFAMLYGNGKSVLGEVPGIFFLTVSILTLLWLERSSYKNGWAYLATGLAVGLCVVTKPIFILLLPALALAWLIRWRHVRLQWDGFAFGILAFLAPVIFWFRLQFGGSDSFSSIVPYYANPYHIADLPSFVLHSVLQFFVATTPFYTFVLCVIWGAAWYVRYQNREKTSIAELALFLFSLIIIAASLRLPSYYRYLFPAATAALLFLPSALFILFDRLRKKFSLLDKHRWLPYAFLLCLFCAQLYQLAFSSYVAEYYSSTRVSDVTRLLATLPPHADIFVYNVPELVVLLGEHPYYQFLDPVSIQAFGHDQLPRLAAGVDSYVILGASDYSPADPQFAQYRTIATANRYLLLKKR